jgi:hypothetical protein
VRVPEQRSSTSVLLLREGEMRPTHLHRVPTLGYIFLRIGAAAFGGLGASLALIERELVTKRQWLTGVFPFFRSGF